MKILIVGDIHMSPTSSIIKHRGEHYTDRLENCIKSINWCEEVAEEYGCTMEVFLGDTFNKPSLDQETITAVKEIKWNNIEKYFLVGNHESEDVDLKYSSANILKSYNRNIVNHNESIRLDESTQAHFIPYIAEANRLPLESYLDKDSTANKHIVFSHNDIAGIQMGVVISKTGFLIDDILANCDMFINGHLHNGMWVNENRIRNLGILTGQNFGEDANKYMHNVMILDTDTLTYIDVENPYAFNFYNLSINTEAQLEQLQALKNNAIISVKCTKALIKDVRDIVEQTNTIIESRIVMQQEISTDDTELEIEDLRVDHLKKLVEFCKEKIDNTSILDYELQELCK